MMSNFRQAVAVAAISVFASAAADAASRNSSNVLQYIPADTPYVVASTEPAPKKLAEKLEPTIDGVLQAYQTVLRHVMDEQLAKLSEGEAAANDAEKVRGIFEEFIGLMSLDALRDAGIDRESAMAFYGNGIIPVLRFELSDEEAFDAMIERFESKAESPLSIGTAKGKTYKFAAAGAAKIVIATLNEQAVVTIIPMSFDEAKVAQSLGIDKPRKSLAKSKTLRSLGKEYGFSDYMTGYIDNRRIAEIFTGQGSEFDRELFEMTDSELPELDEQCRLEVMEMAGIAPRMVFGYSEMSTDVVESSMIIELRGDIADGLATVPSTVPGLGSDPGGFVSFGVGMNLLKLREFYEARLDAMEASPYECELFADLQDSTVKGRELLSQPIPPVVYSFRGFVANILDVNGLDMGSNTPPDSIDASILLAIENAESLIAMGAMMDPQIAALNLVPDGKPVKLDLPQLADLADQAFAALSANSVSVSIGEGAEDNSAEMLVAKSASPAPFLSMSMDSARYYAMIGDAMVSDAADEEGAAMPMAVREALRDVMRLSGSIYERMNLDVRFTGRGVEIDGRMHLSD